MYLDKALSMIDTPAFRNFAEGKITWDEYVAIRKQPEPKPAVLSLVIDNAA